MFLLNFIVFKIGLRYDLPLTKTDVTYACG